MKTYLLAFGIIGALLVGGIGVLWGLTTSAENSETERLRDEYRQRRVTEATRWAQMTPAQQAAETREREAKALAQKQVEDRRRETERRENLSRAARGACLIGLKQSLHDPGGAEYGQTSDWALTVLEDGAVQVRPIIRARNGFGALRLTAFDCVVEDAGNNQVRVVKLDQIG